MTKFHFFQNGQEQPPGPIAAPDGIGPKLEQPLAETGAQAASMPAAEPARAFEVVPTRPPAPKTERSTYEKARAVLSQAANTRLNNLLNLLQNPNTPPDLLRSGLETIIEYRAAESVLVKAAEEAVFAGLTGGAASGKAPNRLS